MAMPSVTVRELRGASTGAIAPSLCQGPSDATAPPSPPFSRAAAADVLTGAVGTMTRSMRGFF